MRSVGVVGAERRRHEDSIKTLAWPPPFTRTGGPAGRRATRSSVGEGMKGLAEGVDLGIEVADHNIDAE